MKTYCPGVFGSSRRIFFYWLLLLIPALAIGGVAVVLLKRERDRLALRAASAEQARRAALEARTRLVAENVELLIGDVEDGLLDALAQPAETDLPNLLERWQASQPMVRVTFLARASGELLRPSATTPGDEARGFYRRFSAQFVSSPPWSLTKKKETDVPLNQAFAPQKDFAQAEEARNQVQANTSKIQMARKEARSLYKVAPSSSDSSSAGQTASRSEYADTRQAAAPSARAPAAAAAPKPRGEDRRGWFSTMNAGRTHVLGWVQPGGRGDVRGVELELSALVARLGGAMPADLDAGEGLALRDDHGLVLHQAGSIPRAPVDPAARVPLSDPAFAGWEVVGYLEPAAYGRDSSGGFFVVGALLVGIFTVAIVSGGSLLLWQARRSEAEAQQKTSFVANVSHEFKTPLTSIRLYSELLEQGRVASEAKQIEYLRTIGRETQRLARLVNNALDFSRLEQGRKKYQLESLDLGGEVIRILNTQEPRLAEAHMAVKRDLPSEPIAVSTDRDAVEQIVLNLLDNACKYAAAGEEIVVSLATDPSGAAVLRVSDRGPGVPATHRDRIFEKFHRVDETLTAEKTGAGLGLSIARQLARGLGGNLHYEPRPGGGSTFVLTLPRSSVARRVSGAPGAEG